MNLTTLTHHGMSLLTRFAQPAGPGAGSGGGSAAPIAGGAPAGAAGAAAQPSLWANLLPIVGLIVVFWFFVFRPQQKQAKEHKAFVDSLKVGARVVTRSGFFGKITEMDETTVHLEIAKGVKIKVLRSQIAGSESEAAEAVEKAQAAR
jgi:preprotein translocase subunit YajC